MPAVVSYTTMLLPVPVTLWLAVAVTVADSPDARVVRVVVNVSDHGCGVTVTVADIAVAAAGGSVVEYGATYAVYERAASASWLNVTVWEHVRPLEHCALSACVVESKIRMWRPVPVTVVFAVAVRTVLSCDVRRVSGADSVTTVGGGGSSAAAGAAAVIERSSDPTSAAATTAATRCAGVRRDTGCDVMGPPRKSRQRVMATRRSAFVNGHRPISVALPGRFPGRIPTRSRRRP